MFIIRLRSELISNIQVELCLESKVLGEVVLDGWDDGLHELQEDDEVHVNAELSAALHDLQSIL